ncbi:MAG TPA: acyltransferase [Alphaproteobacteria bacterium]
MRAGSGRSGATGFVDGILSLRGLMALLVATSHTLAFTVPADYAGSVFDQAGFVAVIAKIVSDGVNVPMLFFVISGLAIARSLDRKEELGQGLRTYVIFMARRVLRLYPAHTASMIGVMALGWLFFMGRAPIDLSTLSWTGFEFLGDWLNGTIFNPLKPRSVIGNFAIATWSMNLVVWSLYVEVCAIPILPLMHRVVRERNLATDLTMLSGLLCLSVLMWSHVGVRYWFAFHLGMLVQIRGRDVARFLRRHAGGVGGASLAAWLVMLTPLVQPLDWAPGTFIQGASAFAIVSLVVWGEGRRTSRLLDHSVLRWNGRMSYSFYLWHYFILTVAVHELYVVFTPGTMAHYDLLTFAGTEVFTVAIALAIAQLSYSWIEEPCIQLGTRLEAWLRQPWSVPVAAEAGD